MSINSPLFPSKAIAFPSAGSTEVSASKVSNVGQSEARKSRSSLSLTERKIDQARIDNLNLSTRANTSQRIDAEAKAARKMEARRRAIAARKQTQIPTPQQLIDFTEQIRKHTITWPERTTKKQ